MKLSTKDSSLKCLYVNLKWSNIRFFECKATILLLSVVDREPTRN